MSRHAWLVIITAVFFPVCAAQAQDLNGSFTTNSAGENFEVQGKRRRHR